MSSLRRGSWSSRWSWVAGAVLALTACGGGGGGGETPGSTPFADTAATYWVAGTGSRWSYYLVDRRPGADPTPILKTVTDQGEAVVGGQSVRRFEHSWSLFGRETETEYRRFDGREIRSMADLGSEFGMPLAPQDYAEVPAPLVAGQTQTVVDRSERIDLNGDGNPDELRVVVRVTLDPVASLSVPAGDFGRVLRARQDLIATATVTVGGNTASESAGATLTTWYAPGVGVVRRVYEDPSVTNGDNTVTEELVGLDAGGLRAGLQPGRVALDGIGAGTDSATPPALDIVVGGSRFMALAIGAGGSVEGAIRTLDGNLLWRGTVMATVTPYKFASAAVAFDGTDFRVVATRTIPFNSPTEWALVGQRVASDGTLRDGALGTVLDSGVADFTQTLASLRASAREGRLAVAWGRYDPTYVPVAPGLVTSRGYVIEGRVFGASQQPLAPRFELGSGLPAAMAVRQDQFIIVNTGQDGSVTQLSSWAIGAVDGLPVSVSPQLLSNSSGFKGWPRLHPVGDELWLSFAEWANTAGPPLAALKVARLGRDGVALDGPPGDAGRTLVAADAERGIGVLGLASGHNLLAWTSGWGGLQATLFEPAVLAGAAALPAAAIPLVPGDPLGASGPSRSLVWAGPAGGSLLVSWLDNEQSSATPSDRVMFALIDPRLNRP